jgi:ElaB/YqjD/DUF883 family membrane-anchored ribosome-binding protein
MARKSSSNRSNGKGPTVAEDVANIEREIGELMHDIEMRVGKLNALARRSAKAAAGETTNFLSDAMADAADRTRAGAMSDEAARLGGNALRRIENQVGHRPLLTLAVAAGIGFLAGMAGRRQ